MLLPQRTPVDESRERMLSEIERATYLTRGGNHEEARAIHKRYRDDRAFGSDIEASLMVMLLEGLILYFAECDTNGAIDRLFRARAVGLAAKSDAGVAVICSWLAHLYFNVGKHEEMAASIDEAIDRHALVNDYAAERLLLTIADAHSLAGDFAAGRQYYDRARSIAASLGDSLSIAAAAYNRSTLALSHARLAVAVGETPNSSVLSFLLELKSAENLEAYLGLESVLYPYSVWVARRQILEGDFSGAIAVIERYRAECTDIPALLEPALLVDLAYCQLKCNCTDDAISLVTTALRQNLTGLACDDLAVIYSFASQIFDEAGDSFRRDMCREAISTHRSAFDDEIRRLVPLLSDLGVKVRLGQEVSS